jgi:proteic killer suppression protein
VKVLFANDSLKRCYEDQKQRVRAWGQKIARKYVHRVNLLYAAESAEDLRSFPELRFHPLTGDRYGEWAMNLDNFWRLIVVFEDEKLTVVRIEEVSKHYGD